MHSLRPVAACRATPCLASRCPQPVAGRPALRLFSAAAAARREGSHGASPSHSCGSAPAKADATVQLDAPRTAALSGLMLLAMEGAAFAAEMESTGVTYSSDKGEFLKNAAGVGYVLLVMLFLSRVLRRRAKRATKERLAGPQPGADGQVPESWFDKIRNQFAPGAEEKQKEATFLDAAVGALQAGGLGFGLYLFSSKMTALIGETPMPSQYTARNISITVRTIIEGLSWLATFIFCTNAVGLAGLTVQLLIWPDSLKEQETEAERVARQRATGPQLPKVSITSNPAELRSAFAAAEKMGKAEGLASTSTSSVDEKEVVSTKSQ